MPGKFKIAVLVGSLRKDSLNRKGAEALVRLAPPDFDFEFVNISDLPLYDEDVEAAGPPEPWTRFRTEVASANAVLFVTPEYNRSVPGALKNAIDVGSRPFGESAWANKPAAVVSISPGGIGGFGANHHLRQSLVFLNMPVLQQPEAYIGRGLELFDDRGELKNADTRAFFKSIIDTFGQWIEQVAQ